MNPRSDWQLADWLAWQETLNPRGIELGLDRVRTVAARLGLPDARIPTLAVAGTNGKGSSATLAALVYQASGYRVGLYTSPHLLRYNERVAIGGEPVADGDLCRAFCEIERVRGSVALTYFEFGTLAALWLFRETEVDAQVLEVGLGGRLDAVNLVDADCALITNVGLDHTDWLGPDRECIGREKAGIMRGECPAVVVEETPPRSVLEEALRIGARLRRLGQDYSYRAHPPGWEWQSGVVRLHELPLPGLNGPVQVRNAAGVLAAVEALQARLPVPQQAIRSALPALRLPGRYERLGDCIFDVAHNVEAAQILAQNLQSDMRDGTIKGRILLVLGMLRDKPVEAFCRELAPLVDRAFFAGLPPPRGLDSAELTARAARSSLSGPGLSNVAQALAAARLELQPGDRIVVTGSFLTVAAAYG